MSEATVNLMRWTLVFFFASLVVVVVGNYAYQQSEQRRLNNKDLIGCRVVGKNYAESATWCFEYECPDGIKRYD